MTDFILINGFLFGLVLAAPVGPVGVLCVQRTLSEGRLHGLLSGLGAAFGDAIYGAIAAFGISAIQLWIADHQSGLFVSLGVTDAGDTVDNAALLVTGVFAGSALWWFALAFTANLARPYLDGGYQKWVSRVSATILIGFGVYALVTAQFY